MSFKINPEKMYNFCIMYPFIPPKFLSVPEMLPMLPDAPRSSVVKYQIIQLHSAGHSIPQS